MKSAPISNTTGIVEVACFAASADATLPGVAITLTSRLRQAAAHAQDALQHDPTDPWARMVFGLCLSSAGQHERALGELQAALNLNPSFALGHIVFGWALLRAGHFDEALVETGRACCRAKLSAS